MINIAGLTVRFGGVKAINALDARFTAPICGLIGPNGAGKTTLLNTLSGFVRPESGTLELDGQLLNPLKPAARARLGIRRSFQTEQVVEDLSVWDNVLAILDHLPLVAQYTRAAEVARVLDYVGLSGVAQQAGCSLNLYQRRMVELARALAGKPRLLLLDEPGAGMNEVESLQLRQLILGIPHFCQAQLILIDHDVELISATCEETLVLDFGRCIALGPTRAMLKQPCVRKAYLGEN
ncbi:ABC transporter ATP-binding protein [Iodobacter sp.]|uniref:ABC transporter ATP-binding protein n=1 Tax=Iodobacter sp. TaxID=1915058 RepID=UPI0025E1B957|nr:ATP-binding cassette domain-containing protein [Iodobacter sp.]